MDSIMSLLSFSAILPPLLIFIASCFYLSKIVKADAVLIFVGSGIALLVTVFFTLMPSFIHNRNIPVSGMSFYYSVAGIVSLIGGVCFATGFFILITNVVNASKKY
ncbi:hypothetical protein [Pedobacter sp. MC2016-24]|uniref:hypothetical protein n=1 Tax=Pedobacter sp. MC2016-24 TaxID=2780090 RepID=UPI0018815F7B|nr:hypothetical protein [Pedobacter sp. MC2016-24]MBE9598464.1 hypothetical protein [Pedobacter sp. MC2016-24]